MFDVAPTKASLSSVIMSEMPPVPLKILRESAFFHVKLNEQSELIVFATLAVADDYCVLERLAYFATLWYIITQVQILERGVAADGLCERHRACFAQIFVTAVTSRIGLEVQRLERGVASDGLCERQCAFVA